MDKSKQEMLYKKYLTSASAFHNPYTFIPFPDEAPPRDKPSLLSADEVQSDRFTGILELEITTTSPLLTCEADAYAGDKDSHKSYRALTIGEDVIVPASGVRGSLRTLMTIITGGTLGYMDEDLHLCQGRDVSMAIAHSKNMDNKIWASLGIVKKPGNRFENGVIAVGDTRTVSLSVLQGLKGFSGVEKVARKGKCELYIDNPSKPTRFAYQPDNGMNWRVKLSGPPIRGTKDKSEGAINLSTLVEMEIPSQLWCDYTGRHRLADRAELRKGDLVWLELRGDCQMPSSSGDIVSIQWARWGRKGQSLRSRVPDYMWPDYMATDGKVDEVTGLFGQVSPKPDKSVPTFASRIRPENLVFPNAKVRLIRNVDLAPLAQPHPGCMAFYRDTDDPTEDARQCDVRGYKVYRTTKETDAHLFTTQGVYDESGQLQNASTSKVSKTVELLPAASKGTLRLALRSLSPREMAILLRACSVSWRLGGGKPLGLGACSVKVIGLIDEQGNKVALPDNGQKLGADLDEGIGWWKASQQPVDRMRYPRAVANAGDRKHRGGHTWFNRHATPKKGTAVAGLQPIYMASRETLPGQCLPIFVANNPQAGLLYGYDMYAQGENKQHDNRTTITKFVAFDTSKHVTGQERSQGNTSQNRNTRQAARAERVGDPSPARPTVAPTPPPQPGLERGTSVSCVICEDPRGKNRVFARHEPTGRVGFVQSADKMPEELKKIGARVTLYAKVVSALQMQFEYLGK